MVGDALNVGTLSNVAVICAATAADMHDELGRIDALLHDAIGQLTHAFGEAGAALAGASAEGLYSTARRIEEHLSGAVTALQFQDLVSQHVAHLRARLAGLQTVMEALAKVPRDCHQPAMNRAESTLWAALQQLRASNAPGPVKQDRMGPGNVELF